jgi:hypothetical protein
MKHKPPEGIVASYQLVDLNSQPRPKHSVPDYMRQELEESVSSQAGLSSTERTFEWNNPWIDGTQLGREDLGEFLKIVRKAAHTLQLNLGERRALISSLAVPLIDDLYGDAVTRILSDELEYGPLEDNDFVDWTPTE